MSNLVLVIIAIAVIVVIGLILAAFMRRRGRGGLRSLPREARDRYAGQWQAIEARFVDDPKGAVADADRLVMSLYRERGGSEERMPDGIRHARGNVSPSDEDSTESLRRSMQHYRTAVEDLLGADPRSIRRRTEVA